MAIPHEARHILVGRVVGLHARGLDVKVVRFHNPDGIVSGISLLWGYAPPDEEIHGMDPKIKAAFMLFVAGGVAGNKFSGIETIGSGATQTANLWLE